MIPDSLLDITASLLGGGSPAVPSHLAFGSTEVTPGATDTSIPGEFDRLALDSVGVVNNVVTFSVIRTGATAANEYINVIGLFNDATAGDLCVENVVTSLLHTSNFDVEVIINLEVLRV